MKYPSSKSIDELKDLLSDGNPRVGLQLLEDLEELHRIISHWLRGHLPSLEPEVRSLAKYSEVINYFVKDRPREHQVTGGAILRKPDQNGELITQVFLDKHNDVVCSSGGRPYGRRFVARELDRELREAFGSKSLIIVQ